MTAKRRVPKTPIVVSKIIEHVEGQLNLTKDEVVNLIREKFPTIPDSAVWEGFDADDTDAAWTFSGLTVSWKFDREVDPSELGCQGGC